MPKAFFIDPGRCIGCEACVHACAECGTHRGTSMIHLETIARAASTQTTPMVCMHCEDPSCAAVCPADAIKMTADGIVQSASKSRCIACGNCVLACPFGVPEVYEPATLMMKCDMCYDRSSQDLAPMCATVCPSQALSYGERDEILARRPRSRPLNRFRFGGEVVRTKVEILVPEKFAHPYLDVAEAMDEPAERFSVTMDVFEDS